MVISEGPLVDSEQNQPNLQPCKRRAAGCGFRQQNGMRRLKRSHATQPVRTGRSGRLAVRQFRRLQLAAVSPAIQVFDDLPMARTQRLWRVGLLGKCTWQLETVGHGKSSLGSNYRSITTRNQP